MNRRRLLIVGAVVTALGVGVLITYLSIPRIGRWYVRTRVLPKVAKRLGRDIAVDKIVFTKGLLVLDGVKVSGPSDGEDAPLFTAVSITIDFDFWKAARGDVRLGVLTIDRPQIHLYRHADGTDNWTDIVERMRSKAPDDGQAKRKPSPRPKEIVFTHGAMALDDRQGGTTFAVEEWNGKVVPRGLAHFELERLQGQTGFGPGAAADRIVIEADLTDVQGTARLELEGGSASVWRRLSLTGIHGTIAPGTQAGRAQIDLTGGYGGVDANLWTAKGWLDPGKREADVHVRADKFTLEKLAAILRKSPVKSPEKTSVSAALDLSLADGTVSFTGGIEVAGLNLYHHYVAEKPVNNLAVVGTVRGKYDHRARLFELDSASVQFRGAQAILEGYVGLASGVDDGGVRRAEPHMRARLVIPSLPCQAALGAIPPEVVPRLQGFKLAGTFTTDLTVDIDWANLDGVQLGGSIGIYKCKVKRAPKAMDTKRLEEEFEHIVELEPGKWETFVVGPTNPDFVPIFEVSPNVIKSLMTTEDGLFYKHRGFLVSEFRTALIYNLKNKGFKRGASSITMQFVKNVMLYREKTLARKFQELFLTWYVEQTLEKDRIMEIYVNVIEFGPGIYGIGPAARHYFNKRAMDLTPVEAAFFSSILPSPKRRYLWYCDGKQSRWGDAKVGRILAKMREKDKITEEEYQASLAQMPLTFALPEEHKPDKCRAQTQKLIKRVGTTSPKDRFEDDGEGDEVEEN